MQASSSDSEDREGGRKRTRMDNVKVSVSDLASDDFKKVWLSLKAVHDKELHRLQVKLSNMRKARLTEGRRLVSKGNRSLTQPTEASNTKECERCLVNEAYRAVLHQEFNNMQQKNLVQIAELTVENNKLKEENKMLLEKLKATPSPRVQFNFTDSDYEDFVKGTQMKIKHMYTVKAPPQAVQISSSPRHVTKPHNEPKKHPCKVTVEPPPPNKPVTQSSQEIQVVSETSFVDSSCVEDHGTKEANILLSCTAHSVKAALATSRKDESNTFSKPPEVKVMSSKQKCGKSTFFWNFSSISSGEPVIVSETSEESMPCNPNSALASFEKKRQSSSTQVFPIDYTSKYVQKRRSPKFGSSYSAVSFGPLLSRGETTGKSICESENTKKIAQRPTCDSDRVHSESMLKKKDN